MKVTMLAKNRMYVEHNGKRIRIETNTSGGFRIYFPPESRVKMPRTLVVGYRKIEIV